MREQASGSRRVCAGVKMGTSGRAGRAIERLGHMGDWMCMQGGDVRGPRAQRTRVVTREGARTGITKRLDTGAVTGALFTQKHSSNLK
ncbi:hypothetical protein CDL15_Pgr012419 [Punica granatum]|uniref:Uncharacterized protein n=1 Tax=Punica granatum TaxID=22663 RepID=A0A218WY40_PUNGR|nr:hypothetical protein CDL15_Pgr012419 [Punica granatum]